MQSYFYEEVTKSDLGVFATTIVLSKIKIPKFIYNEEMRKIVEVYEKIDELSRELKSAIDTINNVIGISVKF